jgi:hypothetical protein
LPLSWNPGIRTTFRGREGPAFDPWRLSGYTHLTDRGEAIDAEREREAFAPMSAVDGAGESP